MAHDVFISYSSEDKPVADAVCATLEARGIRCWIATRDILASTPYPRAIVEAIDASRILILVFSSNSNKSENVASELEIAFNNESEIAIIPFRIENVKPSKDTAYYLSAPHWLDALTPPLEAHLERLAETVKRVLSGITTPPPEPSVLWGWKLIRSKIAIGGVILSLTLLALWFFDPLKLRTVNNEAPQTINYEQLYNQGVEKLDSTNLLKRLDGIEDLAKVSASGDEDWYWKVMDRLTRYVRDNADWKEGAESSPNKMPQDILKMLEVIAARPPVYPDNADEEYKRNKKRVLSGTDLRGLRLVGTRAHLEYVDFQDAHLDNAVLPGAYFEESILYGASLVGANLNGADMKGVDLRNADIKSANLMQTKELIWEDVLLSKNWQCASLPDDLRRAALAEVSEEERDVKCQ